MPDSWFPDFNIYRAVREFGLKANADNYIQAGWELIETRTSFIGDEAAILTYQVGWRHNAGEPVYPPKIDEGPDSYPQDIGPSAN